MMLFFFKLHRSKQPNGVVSSSFDQSASLAFLSCEPCGLLDPLPCGMWGLPYPGSSCNSLEQSGVEVVEGKRSVRETY
jgi:hypothetical protein